MDDMNLDAIESIFESGHDFVNMMARFLFNTLVVWIMIHFLYFPKSRRREYYFTFMLISVSIFFLIFMMGDVKLKVGFALGLFAIFGIIRYRTESMPVREMTYLFCIIAISVINALSVKTSFWELGVVNAVFIIVTWIFESHVLLKNVSTKLIQYDRIELITPQRRPELIDDLQERTGLHIVKVEIGALDFLRDMAIIKIYYRSDNDENNQDISNKLKLTKEQWTGEQA